MNIIEVKDVIDIILTLLIAGFLVWGMGLRFGFKLGKTQVQMEFDLYKQFVKDAPTAAEGSE